MTRVKLPRGPKAHKPADSGVPVGKGTRFCSFQDVTLRVLKHKLSSVVEWADAYFLRRVKEVAMLSLESIGNRPKAAIATMQYDTRLPVDHQANPCNPMVSYSGISRLRSNTVRTTCITSTTPAPSITTSWIGRLYLSLLDGLKLGCLPKKHSAKSIFKRHKFWHVTSASVVFSRSPKAEDDPNQSFGEGLKSADFC